GLHPLIVVRCVYTFDFRAVSFRRIPVHSLFGLRVLPEEIMNKSDKIFVAGHRGMVGSAIVRRLKAEGFSNLLTRDRSQLDLANESAVARLFAEKRPTIVISTAAS